MLLKEHERKVYLLDQQINDRGVLVDPRVPHNALAFAARKTEELITRAREITKLDNPNSVAQLMSWLEGEDVMVDSLTKKDVAKLLKMDHDDHIEEVLRIRQQLSKSSVKKYQAILNCLCDDNRVRGLFQFYGASRTGRWAGRLVQLQNLPQNKLKDLDLARELLIADEYELFEMLFGNVFDTLSQLIRTAFIGKPTLSVADYRAIEARVGAWFCNVAWRMEVFATHGKIYEASASQMFNIPMAEFEAYEAQNKKHPARQKGKVAELLLMYGGGVNAMVNGGALDMGLQQEELQPLVTAWRQANPEICSMWRQLEHAAKQTIYTKRGHRAGFVEFLFARGCLLMVMPNKQRALTYRNAEVVDGQIVYHGVDPDTKRWGQQSTWGGKLLENCIARGTPVLTSSGWKPIQNVTHSDFIWDGQEWCSHKGVISKGTQPVIEVFGVELTSDHKVLTEKGWVNAADCEGLHRFYCRLPESFTTAGLQREAQSLGSGVHRLSFKNSDGWPGPNQASKQWSRSVVRMQTQTNHWQKKNEARDVSASGLQGLAINERPLQAFVTSSVEKLRCAWNHSLQAVGEKLRSVLAGHGPYLCFGFTAGSYRQRGGLQPRELQMGFGKSELKQQAIQPKNRHPKRIYDSGRSSCCVWREEVDTGVPRSSGCGRAKVVRSSGREEQVFDILNVGPRNRFVVKGKDCQPLIVHNCCQAISRDVLADEMLLLSREHNVPLVMHVHDEIVAEGDHLDLMLKTMDRTFDWAPGLVLGGDGYLTNYYRKDD